MKSDKAIKALLIETKANEAGEDVYYFQATVGTKDREGEIVTVDGWDFQNFLKNPVFMVVHDYERLPIGKIVELEPNDIGFKIGVVFDDEDTDAVKVKRKYDRGFMNAVSVGFIRVETTGKRVGKDWVTTKKELLEVSAVPIPGHPDALMIRKDIEGMEDQVKGTKAVDFNTALTLTQTRSDLWDRKWRMRDALETSCDTVAADETLTPDQKVAAITVACTQYGAALAQWYIDKMACDAACEAAGMKNADPTGRKDVREDEPGTKAGRAISKKNTDTIQAAIDEMSSCMKSLEACSTDLAALIATEDAEGDDTGDGANGSTGTEDAGKTAANSAAQGTPDLAISEDALSALKAFVGNKEDK